jgi:dihydrofolate reductase
MRKLILVVHTSLDGFVAGQKGELDGFTAGEENLEFVCRLTKQADTALFGRVSFQLLNSYWPMRKDHPEATWNEMAYSCWYNVASKIVVSTTLQQAAVSNATIISTNVVAAIRQLKQAEGKQILLFGSPALARTLQQHGLIDDYWLFVNPVIFGGGIQLFTGSQQKEKLQLVKTKQFTNGELALHYKACRQPHTTVAQQAGKQNLELPVEDGRCGH